jgi:hypothetical protein
MFVFGTFGFLIRGLRVVRSHVPAHRAFLHLPRVGVHHFAIALHATHHLRMMMFMGTRATNAEEKHSRKKRQIDSFHTPTVAQ